MAFGHRGDFLGRAGRHDGATAVAALRTKVNHIVGGFDDVEVMLDNKHGVPRVHQTLQYLKQLTNIIEVEAGSGLIENIEGFACLATLKLACQLHTLSLTTRKRSGGLAQANIAQAHIVQSVELARQPRDLREETASLVNCHVQNVVHVLASVRHFQRFAIVPFALAHLAVDVNIGQEMHLYFFLTIALARLAATARHVEREAAGCVATHLRLWRGSEQGTDIIP